MATKTKRKAKSKKPKSKTSEPILSIKLQESFARFLDFVSPKHFSRSLRDATLEISENCEEGVPLYHGDLVRGLEMFFHVLDLAEDEGKYNNNEYYD